MATISLSSGNYVRPRYLGRTRIKHFLVADGQTIRKGDVLVLNSDANEGQEVVRAADDPTVAVVGVAAEALTTSTPNVATDTIPVWLADDEAEFVIHVENNGSDGTLDNDQVGEDYGVVRDSTYNIWRLDLNETSSVSALVLELLDNHADVNGRVVVKFIEGARLYQ